MPLIHEATLPDSPPLKDPRWWVRWWRTVNPLCKYGNSLSSHGPGGMGCKGCLDETIQDMRRLRQEWAARERQKRVREIADGVKLAMNERFMDNYTSKAPNEEQSHDQQANDSVYPESDPY